MSSNNKKRPVSTRFSPFLIGFHSTLNMIKTSLSLASAMTVEGLYTSEKKSSSAIGAVQKKLCDAIISESFKSHQAFLQGLYLYETSFRAPKPQMPVPLWRKGSAALFDFGPKYGGTCKGRPVLFIPSLINKAYIFDIHETKGFFAFLVRQGIRPYLFDWGSCGPRESLFSFRDYLTRRLLPAARFLYHQNKTPFSVTGYCMGGVFGIGLRTIAPDLVSSLALFATPWDFHQGLSAPLKLDHLAYWADAFFKRSQKIDGDFLQLFFHALDPFSIQKKFRHFAQQSLPEHKALRPSLALEDWLNDTVSVSLPLFQECCRDWYGHNKPYLQKSLGGLSLMTEKASFPAYLVTPTRDRLVPKKSAQGLLALMPGAHVQAPHTGHVGLFGSKRAQEAIWGPYVAWVQNLVNKKE